MVKFLQVMWFGTKRNTYFTSAETLIHGLDIVKANCASVQMLLAFVMITVAKSSDKQP